MGIASPRRNSYTKNCHYRYHQPLKVVISSPYMPALCIQNAKYDNPQAIQWSTRLFGVHFMSEFAASQFLCKELPLTVSSTPKSHYQESTYANAMHRQCKIWQSPSNSIEYKMLWSILNVRILSIANLMQRIAINGVINPGKSLSGVQICQLCA